MRVTEAKPNSFIFVADNAISARLCNNIINTFESDKEAQHPGHTITGHYPEIKKTHDLGIDPTKPRWASIDKQIYKSLHIVLEQVFKLYPELAEMKLGDSGYNIQRYTKNEGRYVYHMDESGGDNGFYRQLSAVIYLNNVVKGGETHFKYLGLKVKPKRGRIVVFPPFWMYLHRGCKPISSDKYIISTFIQSKD